MTKANKKPNKKPKNVTQRQRARPTVQHKIKNLSRLRTTIQSATAPARIIAETMALPHGAKPLRLPGPGISVPKTGVVAYAAVDDVTFGVTSSASSGQVAGMLIPSPSVPFWFTVQINPFVVCYNRFWVRTQAAAVNKGELPTSTTCIDPVDYSVLDTAASNNIAPPVATYNSRFWTLIPRGPTGTPPSGCQALLVGRDGTTGAYLTAIDANVTFNLQFTNGYDVRDLPYTAQVVTSTSFGVVAVLNYTSLIPEGYSWVRIASITCNGLGSSAPTYSMAAANDCIISCCLGFSDGSFEGGPAVIFDKLYPFKPFTLISYADSAVPYQSSRVNAVGLLASNVTKVLSKQGVIRGVRIDSSRMDPWSVSSVAGFPPKDVSALAMENGLYTFCVSATEHQYHDSVDSFPRVGTSLATLFPTSIAPTTTSVLMPIIPISDLGFVNKFFMTDPNTGSGDSTALSLLLDLHLEFKSSSQLFPTDITTATTEDYRSAITALSNGSVFFENPTHFAAVAGMVIRGLRAAWPVLAPAARAAALAAGQTLLNSATSRMKVALQQKSLR